MRAVLFASLMGLASGQFTASQVRTCTTDADCRIYTDGTNDLLSTCTTGGLCVCGTTDFGTYTPVAAGPTFNQCFRSTDTAVAATAVSTYMTMIWEEGNCDQINAFQAQFLVEVNALLAAITVNPITPTINHYCGIDKHGVLTLIQMNLRATDLFNDAVINLVTNLRARLLLQDTQFPALRFLKFDSSLAYPVTFSSLNTAAGSVGLCPNAGAVMAYFGTKDVTSEPCRAISCTDATLTLADGFCFSNVTPADPSSDDSLSGGAIAGIAIGGVVFIVILILIIYCCCCKDNGESGAENTPDDE